MTPSGWWCCLGTVHVPSSSHSMNTTLQVGSVGQASVAHVMHCIFCHHCINVYDVYFCCDVWSMLSA